MKQIAGGVFLVIGAVISTVLRFTLWRASDSAYSRASDDNFLLGTGIGVIVGLAMIAKGVTDRRASSSGSDASFIERLSTMEISKTVYFIAVVVFGILAYIVARLTGYGGGH